MEINVGSINPVKVDAVREALKDYAFFDACIVRRIGVYSGVSDQPLSLEETITGARNRAKSAFDSSTTYSFGIESGLFSVPFTKSGYMNTCVCAIYDGNDFSLGLSSSFEHPSSVMNVILGDGLEVTDAYPSVGITKDSKIGSGEGALGILTNGRIDRKEYTKQAIQMALIQLEQKELYSCSLF